MNPVVGLDVAKGESMCQVFWDKGKPHGKGFGIQHTRGGFKHLHEVLLNIQEDTAIRPVVIFESTGHYHTPIIQFLEEQDYLYILVNPLVAHQAKKSSLRKVKTDAIDAYRLCELYYKEEFEPFKKRGLQLLNLRSLTRQHESITNLCVQTKLQFTAVLDQVFPEYRGVFGDLYSNVSLNVLKEFPTAESVFALTQSKLAMRVNALCTSRSLNWASKKSEDIIAAAARNPFYGARLQSNIFSMRMYIDIILQYKQHLSALENEIDALAEIFEEWKIVQSIPGVGEKIAATIISEIGEIERFNHPKKLVAFAGVDPSVFASGKFVVNVNRITKRGYNRLRHTLYVAVLCGLRKSGSKRLKAFYDRKREEGKPHKLAVVACINKMIHWIYALLKRNENFLDLAY